MKKSRQQTNTNPKGITMRVEIKDDSYRTLYRHKYNLKDKKAIHNFLALVEKFSGFTIRSILDTFGGWF